MFFFFCFQVREARDARDYSVLSLVETCVDDAHSWASDVASALKIITSHATPQVKAHWLTPTVCVCVCVCVVCLCVCVCVCVCT